LKNSTEGLDTQKTGDLRTLASFIRIANTIALPYFWVKFLHLNAKMGCAGHETGQTPANHYSDMLRIIRFRDATNLDGIHRDTVEMVLEDLSTFFEKLPVDDLKMGLNILIKSRKWMIEAMTQSGTNNNDIHPFIGTAVTAEMN